MVWINVFFNKIKFLIISFADIIKYICCKRNHNRKLSTSFVPLSSVGVVPNDKSMLIETDHDTMYSHEYCVIPDRQPKNVQDCINEYREQKFRQLSDLPAEQPDFFQNMEPKLIRQKKVLIQQDNNNREIPHFNSRLSFSDVPPISKNNELTAWEEMESIGNWDLQEENTDTILKEKRRLERERRIMENMKKRMDKDKNRIASKIS